MMIRLPATAESALSTLAIRERRDARRQAEVLVLEGLRDRGLIESETPPPQRTVVAGVVTTAAALAPKVAR